MLTRDSYFIGRNLDGLESPVAKLAIASRILREIGLGFAGLSVVARCLSVI